MDWSKVGVKFLQAFIAGSGLNGVVSVHDGAQVEDLVASLFVGTALGLLNGGKNWVKHKRKPRKSSGHGHS